MVTWNTFISMTLICLGTMSPDKADYSRVVREIPIMNVNIYVMGRALVDDKTKSLLDENFEYLNQEFEGAIEFNFNALYSSSSKAFLPELYDDFHFNNQRVIDSLILPVEVQGGINVYLFDTHPDDDSSVALMGFSPRLVNGFEAYEQASPMLDRIFMAYEGLNDKSTLIHEMGHFFGLSHPWEISEALKVEQGILNESDARENHMSYGPEVHEFTHAQLHAMREYVLNYRRYLTQGILKIYERA